ncbi:hypothetical protein VB780_19450 [Leptolyngbya sp. CCNP1308]|uniref:DUF6883 domain-containing protein n=1 Tax=Leptolyngbya sp. CCNP1308 TaxID=3110255 RepID=UPI002B1FD45A|nr:DUF6883 domain-containing protein [Leptolyngbya sp. CCNP1308]MEA5450765.1 hypothetical protein [Leptolyngbya sp. CCNP1308]
MVSSDTSPEGFEFPLEKAEYLFSATAKPGLGGDKQRFWTVVMGFRSPAAIRTAVLLAVTLDALVYQSQNEYGRIYRAYLLLTGPAGLSRRVRTIWIVEFDTRIARFVTAVPDRGGGLP